MTIGSRSTRRPGSVLSTRFVARRINFATPGNPDAKYHSSAPFGCVLLVWNTADAKEADVAA